MIDLYYSALDDLIEDYVVKEIAVSIKSLQAIDYSLKSQSSHNELSVAKMLKELFYCLKNLLGTVKSLPILPKTEIKLKNFTHWFIEIIPIWFEITTAEFTTNIERAIDLNQKIDSNVKYSSSATDTHEIIFGLFISWKLLDLPMNEEYENLLLQVFKHATNLVLYYVNTLKQRFDIQTQQNHDTQTLLKREDFLNDIDRYGEFFCNVRYIYSELENLANEFIQFSVIKDKTVTQSIEKFCNKSIETTKKIIEEQRESLVLTLRNNLRKCIGSKVKEHLESLIKNSSAFDSLFEFLDTTLTKFYDGVEGADFDLIQNIIYTELIIIIKFSVDKAIAENLDSNLFSNLSNVLDELKTMFSTTELDSENSARLVELRQNLQIYGCTSSQLIHSYFTTMIEYQSDCAEMKLGVLTVKADLHEDCLELMVLNGRDIKPHSSKIGQKPDTYVEVQLIFSQPNVEMKSVKTKVQEKNHFPLYDELFKL